MEDSEDDEFTSYENVDRRGRTESRWQRLLVRHPFINTRLQQLLAKWAFKVSTGGGFRMPAFALADDGYLFAHDGQVFAGSDWIPEGCERQLAFIKKRAGDSLSNPDEGGPACRSRTAVV